MRVMYELHMTATQPLKPLTVAEVASHLAVDPATVRRWIKAGTLPAYKVGRDYRIDQAELRAVIDAQRTHSHPLTTTTARPVTA